jgi:flagellar FliJ protein
MSFRLEALLQHRRFVEEGLQRQLADFQRHWAEAEGRLQDLRRQREETRQRRQVHLEAAQIPAILDCLRFLERQAELIRAQEQRVARLAAHLETKRAELLEAVKQRKMVDKLKARYLEEEQRREAQGEQKLIDELGSARHGGPGAAGGGQMLPPGAATRSPCGARPDPDGAKGQPGMRLI